MTAVCVCPGSLAPRELAARIWSWEWMGSRHPCSVLMSQVSGVLAWVPGGCRGKSNDLQFGAGLEGHHAETCCVSPRRLAVRPDCYPQLNPAGSAEGQGQGQDTGRGQVFFKVRPLLLPAWRGRTGSCPPAPPARGQTPIEVMPLTLLPLCTARPAFWSKR